MKLLLDSCLSYVTVEELRRAGFDVEWTGDNDPGDPAILARAHTERRVLVTLDKDFGELAMFRGTRTPASSGWSTSSRICMQRCASGRSSDMGGALEVGAIVTVETDRTRVRVEDEDDEDA